MFIKKTHEALSRVCSVQENEEPAPAQDIVHPATRKVGPALAQCCSSINKNEMNLALGHLCAHIG